MKRRRRKDSAHFFLLTEDLIKNEDKKRLVFLQSESPSRVGNENDLKSVRSVLLIRQEVTEPRHRQRKTR